MNAAVFQFTEESYYITQIINLIGYSYNELSLNKASKPYNRDELRTEFYKAKGHVGNRTKLELEDYLRNDLVENYIKKNKHNFKLSSINFACGVDEIEDNISIGSLDIRVSFPTESYLENEPYLAFECKRIDRSMKKKKYYIDHGINRFIKRKYYPTTDYMIAGIICFMESENEKHHQFALEIVSDVNDVLMSKYPASVKNYIFSKTPEYNHYSGIEIFDSDFVRHDDTELKIYHLFLDYYSLIN